MHLSFCITLTVYVCFFSVCHPTTERVPSTAVTFGRDDCFPRMLVLSGERFAGRGAVGANACVILEVVLMLLSIGGAIWGDVV